MLTYILTLDRDHTADIQLHAWGADFPSALEHLALSMFGYMTDLGGVAPDPAHAQTVCVVADDQTQLVFRFLDELLYKYVTEQPVASSDHFSNIITFLCSVCACTLLALF